MLWPSHCPSRHTALALIGLLAASCTRPALQAAFLDPSKLAAITVGQSSRADVFAALGRPARTERSSLGEAWAYEAVGANGGPSPGLVSGASAATSVAGAFVPYVGLLGTGIGLANSAADSGRAPADKASLTVRFDAAGVVADCIQSSTALPAGLPGAAPPPADCKRPSPRASPTTAGRARLQPDRRPAVDLG